MRSKYNNGVVVFRKLIRNYLNKKSPDQSSNILYGSQDLQSLREFTDLHIEKQNQNKKLKGFNTKDSATINLAQNIIKNLPEYKKIGSSPMPKSTSNFFEQNILNQPTPLTKETGSIKIIISDINDFPQYLKEQQKNIGKSVMVCIGGPAAEDQTVLASMIGDVRKKLEDVIYITRDYQESNVNHSAKQSHARHGNALNADKNLTGHSILPVIIMRKLLGVDPKDVLHPDYLKIDIEFTIDPKKLRIYFANELNWLKQEYKRRNGQLTEHDINRLESVLSQQIMHMVEKQSGLELSGNFNKIPEDSSAIHVTFTKENDDEVQHENKEFARVGIKSKSLDSKEKELFFGDNKDIYGAYKYFGDTHLKFNTHDMNREFAQNNGSRWIESEEVSRIFVKKNPWKEAQLVGILTKSGEYIFANKMHFTGGYKVEYDFDKESQARFQDGGLRSFINKIEDSWGLQKPLNNDITTATGVSANAIFKKSDRLKRIIEKYGSTGEIAVTNSHWTMIAQNDDYIIMRMTGGGNTGSEEYDPSYFLNIIANTRRIFGDDLIGILSTYGCPRAMNGKNATEFTRFAEGGIISYGKGGTGNTKRHTEAAFGLLMVGFDKEIVRYFNQFNSEQGKLLGDELVEIYKHSQKVRFFHDNITKTSRRMGYDQTFSLEEMVAIGSFIALLSYGLYKGLVSTDPRQKER
jgi:hypothetical protein